MLANSARPVGLCYITNRRQMDHLVYVPLMIQ